MLNEAFIRPSTRDLPSRPRGRAAGSPKRGVTFGTNSEPPTFANANKSQNGHFSILASWVSELFSFHEGCVSSTEGDSGPSLKSHLRRVASELNREGGVCLDFLGGCWLDPEEFRGGSSKSVSGTVNAFE